MRPAALWVGAVGPVAIVRNVLVNWGALIVGIGINFVLSPYVVHTLGDTAYGVWAFLSTIIGYLGLLELGVRGAVTRYVARCFAAREHDEAGHIASAAFAYFRAMGLIVVAASALLAFLVNRAFHVPEELAGVARLTVLASGVAVAIALVSGVFGGIVVARQRFDYLNGVGIVVGLLRAALVVLVLAAGGGLVGLALAQTAASALQATAEAWISRRAYPELRLRLRAWEAKYVRAVVSFGVWASLLHLCRALTQGTGVLVIGAHLPVAMITFFAIAASMVEYARGLVAGISQTLTPMASAVEYEEGAVGVRRMLLRGARFATLTVLPLVVTFELRGSSFIALWMGPAYGGPAGAVLMVLAGALAASAGFQVLATTMMGVSRHRGLVPVYAGEAVANILLSVWLVRVLGLVGVAWGAALPRLVVCLIVGPLYARWQVGLSVRAYWEATLVRPWLSMVPFALASGAVEEWWPASSLFVYFTQVAVVLPVAALGVWTFALTSGERDVLRGIALSHFRAARWVAS